MNPLQMGQLIANLIAFTLAFGAKETEVEDHLEGASLVAVIIPPSLALLPLNNA